MLGGVREGEGRDMRVPHSVALQECKGLLYVADREGRAVHAFAIDTGALQGGLRL